MTALVLGLISYSVFVSFLVIVLLLERSAARKEKATLMYFSHIQVKDWNLSPGTKTSLRPPCIKPGQTGNDLGAYLEKYKERKRCQED